MAPTTILVHTSKQRSDSLADAPLGAKVQSSNYEGFDFPVPGPYQEFPIEESGVYTGGTSSILNPKRNKAMTNTLQDRPVRIELSLTATAPTQGQLRTRELRAMILLAARAHLDQALHIT